ncbi:MAG: hypothetical protein IKA22_00705 [Lentisphaeria bacterium]|nr:hypothetical protein [Lentisphaeria bacterium]
MECQKIRDEFLKLYSQEEISLIEKLNTLFCKWNEALAEYRKDNKDFAENYPNDYKEIVPDGFYPKYLSQKLKILFLGRESYTIEGRNYIDLFIDDYLVGKTGKNHSKSINSRAFHRRLIQVAYGLLNGKNWDTTPYAKEICTNKGIFEKVSFAFMNLSKLSNNLCDSETTNTNWALVNASLDISLNYCKNFILEEVKLLDPDVIVCMYWGKDIIERIFGKGSLKGDSEKDFAYNLNINGRDRLFLHSWHFSSSKKEKECIHDPIVEAFRTFNEDNKMPEKLDSFYEAAKQHMLQK